MVSDSCTTHRTAQRAGNRSQAGCWRTDSTTNAWAIMASGKTHARVAVVVMCVTAAISPYIAQEIGAQAAGGVVAGAVAGWLVTPDADIPHRTHDEWRMIRRLPVLGRLWVAYWSPYGELFTHRGISHAPVIGTLTRALYALWWLPFVAETLPVPFLVAMLAAWCVQDMAHLAADGWRFRWVL